MFSVKDYVKCVRKPNFSKIFSKNFVAIHQIEPLLILNKPIYMGFSILDLSKLMMYKFHHESIKNKFDAKLLFTETDSLVYEIKTKSSCGRHCSETLTSVQDTIFLVVPFLTQFAIPCNVPSVLASFPTTNSKFSERLDSACSETIGFRMVEIGQ